MPDTCASLLIMLSLTQLERFNVDGFLMIERLLSMARVRALLDRLATLEPCPNVTRVKRGVAFARRNLLELEWLARFANNRALKRLLRQISPGLRPVRAILFDKTGLANWTVPWHQDRSIALARRIDTFGFGPWSEKAGVVHVQPPVEILRQMLTLRVHLDPCSEGNGPLRVVPGTHAARLSAVQIEEITRGSRESQCVCGAGGALLMRPLILHASSPAAAATHRRVLHVEYGPEALPGGLSWAAAKNQPS